MSKVRIRLPLHREPTLNLKTEEWVEVRSKEEILSTLDERGELDSQPFMPEMFQYCGKRFRVFRRAHKTCDTVNRTGGRTLPSTVHLDGVRCDGSAHGGCAAACLIFWKEAWLKRVAEGAPLTAPSSTPAANGEVAQSERNVLASTRLPSTDAEPVYSCQATRLPAATTWLPWWDVRQYAEDYLSGNNTLTELGTGLSYVAFFKLVKIGNRTRTGVGGALVRMYDRFQKVRGGVPFPRKTGVIPTGQRTPVAVLNLKPGELVRVKSYEEVLATLDWNSKNRGLYFDAEEVPYCGGTYRVRSRVDQIIDERTGKMIRLKDSVILENVWCKAYYSDRRMFCPRAIYSFWKEVWLERVTPEETTTAPNAESPRP